MNGMNVQSSNLDPYAKIFSPVTRNAEVIILIVFMNMILLVPIISTHALTMHTMRKIRKLVPPPRIANLFPCPQPTARLLPC